MFFIQEDIDYSKIRGILVLIGVLLFYFAFMLLGSIVQDQIRIFTNGSFSVFINKNSINYDPVLASKIVLDIISYTILFILSIYLIVIFFKKRQFFPKLLIIFLIFHFSLFLIDYIMITTGVNHSNAVNSIHFPGVLYKNFILFIILIVYLLESEQVKRTFTR